MENTKIRVTKIETPMFFLKIGAILIYNLEQDRIYSEDMEQYMPAQVAEKAGLEFEILWDEGKISEQEAIKYLQIATDGDEKGEFSNTYKEMCKLSIQALKKQIPEKVISYHPWEGKCPCCSVIFTSRSTSYCGNCGQKLDWSGIE